jgi:hypothetical protein
MHKMLNIFAGTMLIGLGSFPALAQDTTQENQMNFFVTSVGSGDGANLGGLAGADRHCQALAQAAEAGGKTWRAYLSASAADGQAAVNARDRIGQGPWYNHGGRTVAKNLSELHGDTLVDAQNGNIINLFTAVTETGERVNGVGAQPNKHDILTGSQLDGRAYTDGEDHTCSNWTNNDEGSAQVGHHDRTSPGNISWNSSHPSRGCSQENLQSSGGDGLFYCFAID